VALLVLGPLVLHTRSVATHYFEAGRLLHNLDLAYRQVPPGMLEIDVACAPGLAESLVTRYVRYLEATDTRPRLRIVDPGAANAALVVFPDGSVLLR
jgi:hypothetical protein